MIYVGVLSLIVTQVSAISALLMPVIPAADNLNVLAVLRFITGLGLGAVVPLGVVIVNEFAPRRRRAAMVTLMGCGYAMGAASGGFLASYLVPAFGWEAQFYIAAGLTLVMAVVLWLHLPESIRLLTIRGRTQEIAAILRRINPALAYPPDTQFVIRNEAREASANKFRPVRLFMENRATMTVLDLARAPDEHHRAQLPQQLAADARGRSRPAAGRRACAPRRSSRSAACSASSRSASSPTASASSAC